MALNRHCEVGFVFSQIFLRLASVFFDLLLLAGADCEKQEVRQHEYCEDETRPSFIRMSLVYGE